MTLFPTGDKGQRYEISSTGYPVECPIVVGWAEAKAGAEQMASSFRLAPGCVSTMVRDRWGIEPPITIDAAHG